MTATGRNTDKAFASLFSNAAVLLKRSVFTQKTYHVSPGLSVHSRAGVNSGHGAVRHSFPSLGHSKLNTPLFSLARISRIAIVISRITTATALEVALLPEFNLCRVTEVRALKKCPFPFRKS